MEKTFMYRGYDLRRCSASVLASLCYKMEFFTGLAWFYIDHNDGPVGCCRLISKSYFNRLLKRFLVIHS